MGSDERIFYQERLSAREQVVRFNKNVLALASEFNGDIKMMRIEINGNDEGDGYQVKCTPMKWERVLRTEEKNEKRNKKKKGKMVEISDKVELVPMTRELRRDVPSVLANCNLILNISSNRKLFDTSPSAVLTDVVLKKNSTNELSENGSKKTLDLWVSARDGVQKKGSFQTYRASFNEQGEWAKELIQVNELIREVVEDLREESNIS